MNKKLTFAALTVTGVLSLAGGASAQDYSGVSVSPTPVPAVPVAAPVAAPGATAAPATAATPQTAQLPVTGSDAGLLAAGGATLVLVGYGLTRKAGKGNVAGASSEI